MNSLDKRKVVVLAWKVGKLERGTFSASEGHKPAAYADKLRVEGYQIVACFLTEEDGTYCNKAHQYVGNINDQPRQEAPLRIHYNYSEDGKAPDDDGVKGGTFPTFGGGGFLTRLPGESHESNASGSPQTKADGGPVRPAGR